MEDSFFGFDTSAPFDDDGGGRIAEPSEEEYDALNDETFGSAINGDWEEAHENLVRLTDDKDSPKRATSTLNKNEEDSDLEFNLSSMKLDDVDITFDDGDAGINLDPLVWANPVITTQSTNNLTSNNNDRRQSLLYSNPEAFLREHFPTPFNAGQQLSANVKQSQQQQPPPPPAVATTTQPNNRSSFPLPPVPASTTKICTVEDIERSIIAQQHQQKQQKEQQQQQQLHHHQQLQQQHLHQQQQLQQQQHHRQVDLATHMLASTPKPKTPIITHSQLQQPSQHMHQPSPHPPPQQHPHSVAHHHSQPPPPPPPAQSQLPHPQQQQPHPHQPPMKFPPFPNTSAPPPGFNGPRPNFNNLPQQHPLNNLLHPAGPPGHHNRHLPPGFQPVPIFPPGMPGPHPLPNYPPRPMPNLPIALNNFAMHPNFNAIRSLFPPTVPPRMPPHPNLVNPNSSSASAYNMFNQRLVQEIQQNHPMLPNARHNFISTNNTIGPNVQQHPPQHQQQHNRQERKHSNSHNASHGNAGSGHHINIGHNHSGNMRSTGNLPVEYDEYANLMSTRDKHWLISIQLAQLNTDTPYIDDYYYTVFKERRAELNGDSGESKTHKDNQLNHPLTQPKGHAQMILVSLGNKNGMNNRNGQNNRERKNSETKNDQEQQRKYVYTPLKFENSLGKLQCGSVTAPRKLIDMDIMGPESSPQLSTNIELSAQRKSRYILLHIETLYRIILKLEDLDNPAAVETIKIKKEKEKERLQLLEQMENESRESTGDEKSADTAPPAISSAMKSKFTYELEPKDVLMTRLVAGLAHDKVIAMMNVRKGKTLIRRVMKHIKDQEARWNVWTSVFSSLHSVLKKDRDDSEGVLFALYPEFRSHVKTANFEVVLKISSAIPLSDKKSSGLFSSKFVISSLVCLILQAEQIYLTATDKTLSSENQETWRLFLDSVATSLNRTIQNQTICAAIESDSIQPMMDHFARFKDLKLDSLLALITQAKQQIN